MLFRFPLCGYDRQDTYVVREGGGGGFAGDYVQENVARGQERNVVTPGVTIGTEGRGTAIVG